MQHGKDDGVDKSLGDEHFGAIGSFMIIRVHLVLMW